MLRNLLKLAKSTTADDWLSAFIVFASFIVAYCFFT